MGDSIALKTFIHFVLNNLDILVFPFLLVLKYFLVLRFVSNPQVFQVQIILNLMLHSFPVGQNQYISFQQSVLLSAKNRPTTSRCSILYKNIKDLFGFCVHIAQNRPSSCCIQRNLCCFAQKIIAFLPFSFTSQLKTQPEKQQSQY